MLRHIAEGLFSLHARDMPRVFGLATVLFTILVSFWILDSLKDSVFATTVGLAYQPYAKIVSVVCTLFVVCIYDHLVNTVSKPKLFYIFSVSFGLLFIILGAVLANSTTALNEEYVSPYNLIGWVVYLSIESYGSLLVALFWAFSNSTLNLEQAKAGYGFLISVAQLGAIFGSTLVTSEVHVSQLMVYGGVGALLVAVVMKVYVLYFPPVYMLVKHHMPVSKGEQQPSIFMGFMEGLTLVFRYSYVTGLLAIDCLFDVVLTMLDYEMKIVAKKQIGAGEDSADDFAVFMGHFGQITNIISLLVSLFGFNFLVNKFGVAKTLLIFPILQIVAVILIYVDPALWMLVACTAVLKGLSFSLSEPIGELLYMPTSDLIKFKAKGWIDVFGARFAKAIGSTITQAAHGDPKLLHKISGWPSIIFSVIVVGVCWYMGRRFDALIRDGEVVGEPQRKVRLYADDSGDEEEDDAAQDLVMVDERIGVANRSELVPLIADPSLELTSI